MPAPASKYAWKLEPKTLANIFVNAWRERPEETLSVPVAVILSSVIEKSEMMSDPLAIPMTLFAARSRYSSQPWLSGHETRVDSDLLPVMYLFRS